MVEYLDLAIPTTRGLILAVFVDSDPSLAAWLTSNRGEYWSLPAS